VGSELVDQLETFAPKSEPETKETKEKGVVFEFRSGQVYYSAEV
jgi:hypothetical protein